MKKNIEYQTWVKFILKNYLLFTLFFPFVSLFILTGRITANFRLSVYNKQNHRLLHYINSIIFTKLPLLAVYFHLFAHPRYHNKHNIFSYPCQVLFFLLDR